MGRLDGGAVRGAVGSRVVTSRDPGVDLERDVAEVARAQRRILHQQTLHQTRQGRVAQAIESRPRRLLLEHGGEDLGHAVAGERALAGERLVETATERPHVAAAIDVMALGLLRAHVGGGADQHAGSRLVERQGRRHRPRRARAGDVDAWLGQSEVEHLDRAARRQRDVRRFEIAMHHAAIVRRGQTVRHVAEDPQRLEARQRAAREPLIEALARDQLHHQEAALAVRLEAVERRDVGMVERGEHARFALEAGEHVGARAELGRQQLDRDLATEPAVPRAVDLAHAAAPEETEHVIAAQALAHRDRAGRRARARPDSAGTGRPPRACRAPSRSSGRPAPARSTVTSASDGGSFRRP